MKSAWAVVVELSAWIILAVVVICVLLLLTGCGPYDAPAQTPGAPKTLISPRNQGGASTVFRAVPPNAAE